MSRLKVSVSIDPVPEQIDGEQFNRLCDGELTAFEAWMHGRMSAAGLEPSPLIGAEQGTLRAFLYFVYSRPDEEKPS